MMEGRFSWVIPDIGKKIGITKMVTETLEPSWSFVLRTETEFSEINGSILSD